MHLTTNGTNFYKIIKDLNLSKLRQITFSLDGSVEETHDLIRGEGVFRKVLNSLESIEEYKKIINPSCEVHINYAINNLNKLSLANLPRIFERSTYPIIINILKTDTTYGNAKLNERLLQINLAQVWGSIKAFYENLLNINESREKRGLEPIMFRLVGFPLKEIFLINSNIKKARYQIFDVREKERCLALQGKIIFVDPYGYFFPCIQFVYKEVLNLLWKEYKRSNIPHLNSINSLESLLKEQFFVDAIKWTKKQDQRLHSRRDLPCAKCEFVSVCTICPIMAALGRVPNGCRG